MVRNQDLESILTDLLTQFNNLDIGINSRGHTGVERTDLTF